MVSTIDDRAQLGEDHLRAPDSVLFRQLFLTIKLESRKNHFEFYPVDKQVGGYAFYGVE
jgi:hypothetical protein